MALGAWLEKILHLQQWVLQGLKTVLTMYMLRLITLATRLVLLVVT